MPTNEERRKVVKELRYTASHSLDGYSFQRSVEGIVFGTLGDRTWRKILERLADLIEPEPERTCRNVADQGVLFECSECGAKTVDAIGNYTQEYCAACGRMVKDAD